MNLPVEVGPNLLGALTVFVNGRLRAAVTDRAGAGGALADAVIVIKDQPGVTADWLGRVLELSQPGAAHLVRRLLHLGWVERRAGADARSRSLHLTSLGTNVAEEILQARHQVLADVVESLSTLQREHLVDIAKTLLRPQARDGEALARLCRLCDRSCCQECPVHAGYLDHQTDH
ncbi:MarR family transcriptional regulator [Micromonospora sp. WMMD1082]|uniref:MarR family winged helix-turn-helix transcriptional regulator n=1 Tax=Micromonospora sp. WMMD1082 TaxID=3016104 RepID=UPI0024161179|nr:MarR family transcriptional regulator [Micromonospora sp. WMMD1082]MDG4795524.1 MarR family transcriptional regulator [Micromonospora sp. WMMD1082]